MRGWEHGPCRRPGRAARRRSATASAPSHFPSCPPTGSSTASCPGSPSTSGCSSSPRTPRSRCSSAPSSWPSSPATSTSSSWCGSPASSAASHTGLAVRGGQRPAPPRGAPGDPGPHRRAAAAPRARASATRCVPALEGHGIELVRWEDLDGRRARPHGAGLRRPDLPGADPARRRPGAPVPVHLRPVAQPRRRGAQPGHRRRALRPGQGPADPAPLRTRVSADSAFVPLEDVIAEHLDQLFPGMEVLEHHAFRVTRNEDVEVEEDEAENLLQALERELLRRRFGPPVRLEVEETIDPHVLDLLVRELDVEADEVIALPGPLDLTGLCGVAPPRPGRPQGPAVPRPASPPTSPRSRPPTPRHLRGRPRPRRAAAPPVRLVLDERAALPRAGGRRPARARDQADALPHLRRLPDRRRPDRRRRVRQAGARPRRDQGALRRAGQHQLGPQARAGRLPRRLRPRRPQDALQALPGGPPARSTGSAATATSAPATTTRRPRGSTRTSACSPPTRRSARTSADLFNELSGYSPQHVLRAAARRAALACAPGCSSGSSGRSPTPGRAGRRGIRIKVNSIVDEQIIDALYRASQAGVAGRALGARHLRAARRACPGCPRTSGCAPSWAASSSTRRIFWFDNDGDPRSGSAAPT